MRVACRREPARRGSNSWRVTLVLRPESRYASRTFLHSKRTSAN